MMYNLICSVVKESFSNRGALRLISPPKKIVLNRKSKYQDSQIILYPPENVCVSVDDFSFFLIKTALIFYNKTRLNNLSCLDIYTTFCPSCTRMNHVKLLRGKIKQKSLIVTDSSNWMQGVWTDWILQDGHQLIFL